MPVSVVICLTSKVKTSTEGEDNLPHNSPCFLESFLSVHFTTVLDFFLKDIMNLTLSMLAGRP